MLISNVRLSFLLTVLTFLIVGCESAPSNSKYSNQPSLKTTTYRDGMVCQEKVTPLFRSLGYECICAKPYESDNYSVKSNKPGYTTECENPTTWALKQDKMAADRLTEQKIKAEQARISSINEAREARSREATLKKIAPYLTPYCQALARRKFNIIKSCDMAGNPAYCIQSRKKSEPIPALPKPIEALTPLGAASQCFIQGYDVL